MADSFVLMKSSSLSVQITASNIFTSITEDSSSTVRVHPTNHILPFFQVWTESPPKTPRTSSPRPPSCTPTQRPHLAGVQEPLRPDVWTSSAGFFRCVRALFSESPLNVRARQLHACSSFSPPEQNSDTRCTGLVKVLKTSQVASAKTHKRLRLIAINDSKSQSTVRCWAK